MNRVSNHLRRLAGRLFADNGEQARFIEALVQPQEYDRAVLWVRPRPPEVAFERKPPLAWQPEFVDRAPPHERPGLDPLHDAGWYYCLDLSSVFAAMALSAAGPQPDVVVDVCAAPGGKATFAWRLLQPIQLAANEVIGKRTGVLIANLRRCGVAPAAVVSRDSSRLAEAWPSSADVVIVDAPCSGQSLLARGKDSPGCFHPATINMNSNRQKRILANSAALVAPGGWLAYMTCTYSPKENEEVLGWLLKKFPHFAPAAVPALAGHESSLADFPCYRLWPQDGHGAGAFTALLRNESDAPRREFRLDALPTIWVAGDAENRP
ncbi:MAG: RsmB/NOP family class I SAM-dependent RNA methyltransferase [Planctomycetes bacterium]|nr:RsmB/NOP family class I SAM-dependent RNA methyltransferase [Planctomycetota bacterium]